MPPTPFLPHPGFYVLYYKSGRTASGGVLPPQPPRATRSQPESLRTVLVIIFFPFFWDHPGKVSSTGWTRNKKSKKMDQNLAGWKNLVSAGWTQFFLKIWVRSAELKFSKFGARDSTTQCVCLPGAGFNPPEFWSPCGLPVSFVSLRQ